MIIGLWYNSNICKDSDEQQNEDVETEKEGVAEEMVACGTHTEYVSHYILKYWIIAGVRYLEIFHEWYISSLSLVFSRNKIFEEKKKKKARTIEPDSMES